MRRIKEYKGLKIKWQLLLVGMSQYKGVLNYLMGCGWKFEAYQLIMTNSWYGSYEIALTVL